MYINICFCWLFICLFVGFVVDVDACNIQLYSNNTHTQNDKQIYVYTVLLPT